MRTSLRQTILATGAVLGLGTLAATAATAAPPPPAAQAMPAVPHPAGRTMAERVDQRIAHLRAELHLTAAQQPQWHRFTAAMQANARDMDRAMRQRIRRLPTMNAEQNMRSYEHVAAVHAHEMRMLVPAFEHLYATLSTGQKRTVDQIFRNDAYRGHPARQG